MKTTRFTTIKRRLKSVLNFSLIFSIALHFAMVIVAAVNFNNCPVSPRIPQFLLIQGLIGIISKVIGLGRNYLIKYLKVSSLISFITTIEFIMFIIGSFYVFKEYKPNYAPAPEGKYCNKTVYLFALVYLAIFYVVWIIVIVGLFCFV